MLSRFRTAWLTQNLTLLVLRLLRESTMTEWEILASLHARYALIPNARDLGRLERELLAQGYAGMETGDEGKKLRITAAGLRALRSMEAEYRSLVTKVVEPGSGSGGALLR